VDTPETSTPAPQGGSARWFARVLPVTAIAIVLIGLAALLSPAFRDQVRLSLSRQPQPYVELYFAKSAAGKQPVCLRKGGSVRVRFVLESHLAKRQPVAYQVLVNPKSTGLETLHRAGQAVLSPGTPVTLRKSFRLPRGGYTVSVVLADLDQHLRAHCGARR
jgi:hypothetical protein